MCDAGLKWQECGLIRQVAALIRQVDGLIRQVLLYNVSSAVAELCYDQCTVYTKLVHCENTLSPL